MPGNSDTIDSFMKAWNSLDIEAIMGHFTEDAAYANVPMGPPNVGKEAIRGFIEGFLSNTTEINFTVHQQVEGAGGGLLGRCIGLGGDTLLLHYGRMRCAKRGNSNWAGRSFPEMGRIAVRTISHSDLLLPRSLGCLLVALSGYGFAPTPSKSAIGYPHPKQCGTL